MASLIRPMIGLALITTNVLGQAHAQDAVVPIAHQYLAQEPPGRLPEVFAEEFFPDWIHNTPVFTNDLSEMYWAKDGALLRARYENGAWSPSLEIRLSERDFDYRDPFLAPSGDKLFFTAASPSIEGLRRNKENIWYSQRNGDRWEEPVALGPNINQYHMHWALSVATNGNLYFIGEYTEQSPIYMSSFINGVYQDPVKLDENINYAPEREEGPFIAPDERYLMFARSPDLEGHDTLYISFNDHGRWTPARKITLENGRAINGLSPVVSPDGRYLFFMAWRDGEHRVFWVDVRPMLERMSRER
jgi:hypothetical protein